MNRFVSTPLEAKFSFEEFSCGNEILDAWLRRESVRAHNSGIARVTVWTPVEQPIKIAAFYSISPAQVATKVEGLPRSASAGYSTVPVWLIGRLAVDRQYQHLGVGRQVLLDAIETIISASTRAGGRLIVVDPINQRAANWYQSFGFTPFGTSSTERPARQFLRIDRAIATLNLK